MKTTVLLILSMPFLVYSSTDGLCTSNEKTFFSCNTAKNKAISICGSSMLGNNDNSYIQYRYGKTKKIELEYPSNRKASLNSFLYTHYFRYQYDVTEVEFINVDYKYSVFWEYSGEVKNNVKTKAGVRIKSMKTGKQFTVNCSGSIDMSLSALEEHVPCNKSNPLAFCR